MKPAHEIKRYDIIMYNNTSVGVQFFSYERQYKSVEPQVTFYSSDETPYTFYYHEMVRVL
jgi:hypothetical protein